MILKQTRERQPPVGMNQSRAKGCRTTNARPPSRRFVYSERKQSEQITEMSSRFPPRRKAYPSRLTAWTNAGDSFAASALAFSVFHTSLFASQKLGESC